MSVGGCGTLGILQRQFKSARMSHSRGTLTRRRGFQYLEPLYSKRWPRNGQKYAKNCPKIFKVKLLELKMTPFDASVDKESNAAHNVSYFERISYKKFE